MRKSLMLSTAVLLLALPGVARAQNTPATTPLGGTVEAGYRTSSVDGDQARWERDRDLRNGLLSRVDLGKENDKYAFRLTAKNIVTSISMVSDFQNIIQLLTPCYGCSCWAKSSKS